MLSIFQLIVNGFLWLIGLIGALFGGGSGSENYAANIRYNIHSGGSGASAWTFPEPFPTSLSCSNVTFIFPGFTEVLTLPWVQEIVTNFQLIRGGCVVTVDYTKYTAVPIMEYEEVVKHYDGLVSSIVLALAKFKENLNYDPNNLVFFGNSYGARVALGVGKELGTDKPGRVDVCEPTSLGFPVTPDCKLSGLWVRGIHTNSRQMGTTNRNCHEDWNMGICGLYQSCPGLTELAIIDTQSHYLCVEYYVSALNNDFFAIPKPAYCTGGSADFSQFPQLKMGFRETRKPPVGEYYCNVSTTYPYTVL